MTAASPRTIRCSDGFTYSPKLHKELKVWGHFDVFHMNYKNCARQCLTTYHSVPNNSLIPPSDRRSASDREQRTVVGGHWRCAHRTAARDWAVRVRRLCARDSPRQGRGARHHAGCATCFALCRVVFLRCHIVTYHKHENFQQNLFRLTRIFSFDTLDGFSYFSHTACLSLSISFTILFVPYRP